MLTTGKIRTGKRNANNGEGPPKGKTQSNEGLGEKPIFQEKSNVTVWGLWCDWYRGEGETFSVGRKKGKPGLKGRRRRGRGGRRKKRKGPRKVDFDVKIFLR